MELRFLNPAVPGTVFLEVLGQFIGGRLAERAECPEILDFEQPGDTFRYFPTAWKFVLPGNMVAIILRAVYRVIDITG